MATAFLNRQTVIGGLIFIFLLWTLSAFTQTTSATYSQVPGTSPGQAKQRPAGDSTENVPYPKVSLPPWYDDGEDVAPAIRPTPIAGIEDSRPDGGKAGNKAPPPAHKDDPSPPVKSTKPQTAPSTSGQNDRPLILYAYHESEAARENLKFFIEQGLHGAADFVFILQGETTATSLIPSKPNIKVVTRPNTCYDLGALGEVLRKDNLYKKYKRFITLNASIRGPFLPYWSQGCWSDVYLSRVTGKTKLVGMTSNCWPQFHVQSMIWATDLVGMELLLNPPAGSSVADKFGDEKDKVALAGCYDDWNKAVHAEVGTTALILKAGYEVDLMMMAYHKSKNYIAECDSSENGDLLWQGKYFGSNVHPYETVFIKANRDIDPTLIGHLTEWHRNSGTTSWDTCGAS